MKASRKEIIRFGGVMIIFIVGMIILMVNKVENPWLWIGYITIWTWIEMKLAKNIHLKWWVWLNIIIGIVCINLSIIYFLN